MYDDFAIMADNLFSAVDNQWSGLDSLANQALSNGIEKYQNEDYEAAAEQFQRAFRLSPYSDYAYEATQYASMSYQAMGKTDLAIKAYEEGIQINQTDDRFRLDLGNLLIRQKRYSEAIENYEAAVRLYDDPTNRFSLGQAYLQTGRYDDAEYQFDKIIQRGGLDSRNGYYGMGQVYRAQEKYDDAIVQFELALATDEAFNSAYEEMGYTYADAGMLEKAKTMQELLVEKEETDAATLLSSYISKVTEPKIMFAYADSTFPYYMSPKSKLSVIDEYLANADTTQTFTMKFQFNKEMDRESIETITNWSIERSTESGPAMGYNNGIGVPETEVTLPYFPTDVYYDDDALTATVRFRLTQNSTADGTIDPSHVVFSFNGKDGDGNDMAVDYDQFMGFSDSF